MKPNSDELEFATTTLLVALSARHPETALHSARVNLLSLDLGRALELPGDQLEALKFGSLLHDIGKLSTPDAVLNKPGRLDDQDWNAIRRHPFDGASLLRSLNFPETIASIVEQHHERHDGTGYPFALPWHMISTNASIVAVADTFDAITADRCYRPGAAPAVALHEIASWSGKQFNPTVVDAFVQLHRPALAA